MKRITTHQRFEVYRTVEKTGWQKSFSWSSGDFSGPEIYGSSKTEVLFDIVFFNKGMKREEVRRSLIEHDGYPADIWLIQGTRH